MMGYPILAMMGRRTPQTVDDPDDHGKSADLGKKVHSDTKTRLAQSGSNSHDAIRVNITLFGAQYHDIDPGQMLEVQVREDGIALIPVEP